MKILPYGEDGAYVEIADGGDASDGERAARTLAVAERLRAVFPAADVVFGAGVVAVFGAPFDAMRASAASEVGGDVYTSARAMCTHAIDVVYDGPDLDDVASRAGLSQTEVIDLHAGRQYTVEVVGFLPGFAYMGPLDARLIVPRRASPRPRVPPQSVAIAASFTGIYPLASPGGWNLIGRSLGPLPFDPARAQPFLFSVGDRVAFRPARDGATERSVIDDDRTAARGFAPAGPALVVVRPPGPATVQDAGRRGLLGRGMPPSGPLDPPLFSAANRAVGNAPGAAAIELLGGALDLLANGVVSVSVDGASAQRLAHGESIRIEQTDHAVRYVALRGGIDVPEVVGARATLLSAKIGGTSGRPLRRGDVLPVGDAIVDAIATDSAAASSMTSDPHILIDPGPHLDRFPDGAFDALLTTEWRVSRLTDRVGARLEGGAIPRSGPDLAAPVPMRRGAVQVTTDGTPIVLGPDHPTTGGYPVLAVVRAASFGALAQRRPGHAVRFRRAPV